MLLKTGHATKIHRCGQLDPEQIFFLNKKKHDVISKGDLFIYLFIFQP